MCIHETQQNAKKNLKSISGSFGVRVLPSHCGLQSAVGWQYWIDLHQIWKTASPCIMKKIIVICSEQPQVIYTKEGYPNRPSSKEIKNRKKNIQHISVAEILYRYFICIISIICNLLFNYNNSKLTARLIWLLYMCIYIYKFVTCLRLCFGCHILGNKGQRYERIFGESVEWR